MCTYHVRCCVSLHPSGGAEHKTTSFKGTSLPVVFTLSAFFFFLFHGLGTTDPHTCHSSHKKRSLLVNRSTTKIIQKDIDIITPNNIWAMLLVLCRTCTCLPNYLMPADTPSFPLCILKSCTAQTGYLGTCFVSMDIGSSKRLAMQNLQVPSWYSWN